MSVGYIPYAPTAASIEAGWLAEGLDCAVEVVDYRESLNLPDHEHLPEAARLRSDFEPLRAHSWVVAEGIGGFLWAADLNAMALISMPRGSSTRHYIDAAFLRNNMQFRPALELSNLATVAAFVKAGCGSALLPHLGARLVQDGELKIIALEGAPERSLAIVTRQEEDLSLLAKKVIAAIRGLAKEWQGGDGTSGRRAQRKSKG